MTCSRTTVSVLLPVLALVAAGCATIDAPAGYIEVKDQTTYDYKAISAQGNVIALNSHQNEDRSADLKFWAQAVEYQKVDVDGMKLAAREDIEFDDGHRGVLFQFEAGEGQGKVIYLVALHVTPSRIHTVEATGPAEAIAADSEALRKSILSLQ